MRESIASEATQAVQRLRHHPSIALYCGNNEDYEVLEKERLEYDWEDKDPQKWLKTSFSARYYYEHLLGAVVDRESLGVPYWPSSPFSEGKMSYDRGSGDLHQWNGELAEHPPRGTAHLHQVPLKHYLHITAHPRTALTIAVWHGTQEKYQRYDQISGRFNSEFGLTAFPQMKTIESFTLDSSELHASSRTLDFHNKADGHERRIATYVAENFRLSGNLKVLLNHALGSPVRSWLHLGFFPR